jgi:hypothetical protein
MNNNIHNLPNGSCRNESKNTKKNETQRLFDILNDKPITRRMAATLLGYPDQTFMVTQRVFDWKEEGKLQITGKLKCQRSKYYAEGITTNPKYFTTPSTNQLNLFEQ